MIRDNVTRKLQLVCYVAENTGRVADIKYEILVILLTFVLSRIGALVSTNSFIL